MFCWFSQENWQMLPKYRFSKPISGHSAGSTKLDRPCRKRFWQNCVFTSQKWSKQCISCMYTIVLGRLLIKVNSVQKVYLDFGTRVFAWLLIQVNTLYVCCSVIWSKFSPFYGIIWSNCCSHIFHCFVQSLLLSAGRVRFLRKGSHFLIMS